MRLRTFIWIYPALIVLKRLRDLEGYAGNRYDNDYLSCSMDRLLQRIDLRLMRSGG